MINLGLSYGSYTEKAFMMLEATLAESVDSGGCNWGLLREDATLNVVGVSDEPEQSINNYSYYVCAEEMTLLDKLWEVSVAEEDTVRAQGHLCALLVRDVQGAECPLGPLNTHLHFVTLLLPGKDGQEDIDPRRQPSPHT